MKKIIYTLLAISIIFSSCKKEDDNTNPLASINGTWEISSISEEITQGYINQGGAYSNTHANGEEIMTYYNEASNNYPYQGYYFTWTFSSDGSFIERSFSPDGNVDQTSSTYTKNGNTLTIEDYNEEPFIITTLTPSTLSFSWSGYDVAYSYDTTFFMRNEGSASFDKSNNKIDSNIQSQNKNRKTPFLKTLINKER